MGEAVFLLLYIMAFPVSRSLYFRSLFLFFSVFFPPCFSVLLRHQRMARLPKAVRTRGHSGDTHRLAVAKICAPKRPKKVVRMAIFLLLVSFSYKGGMPSAATTPGPQCQCLPRYLLSEEWLGSPKSIASPFPPCLCDCGWGMAALWGGPSAHLGG